MSTPVGQLGLEHQESFGASQMPSMDMPQQHMGNMNAPSDDSMMNQVLDRVQTMDNDPYSSNINGEMMSHNMDPSQVPPEQQYQHMPEEQMQMMYHQGQQFNEPEPESESWNQKVQQTVKGPFIIFLIAFLISLPHVTRMLTHFIPRLLQESGQLNLYGVAVKALMIALTYAIVAYATN